MKKELYQNEFKNKKITIMGLGLLGRGIKVTEFLAKCGAILTVTDLKTEEQLKKSIKKLSKYKIKYVLGKHDLKDFENIDMVVKSAGVPLDSPYIKHARENNVEIIMDASVFARIIKKSNLNIKIIGITGTRGKSMTTALIYHILKENEKTLHSKIHIGGNMRNMATLPILEKVKDGDFVVLELDSWQCQGFGDEKIAPNISVFTSFMEDHMNYYKGDMQKYLEDKCLIFKYQNNNDILITNKSVLKLFPKKPKSQIVIPNKNWLDGFKLKTIGEHNEINTLYAYAVGLQCGLNKQQIKKAVENFNGLEGRLQNLKTENGFIFINDNNSTTPTACIAGIDAVKNKYKNKNIILIAGGSNKNIDLTKLAKSINKNCKKVILLKGSGTDLLKPKLKQFKEFDNLRDAVKEAVCGEKGVVLFSPGFASFGMFENEYERNDIFINLINKIKWN